MGKEDIHLITRTDDAGSCQSANEAIRDCCLNGILRSIVDPDGYFWSNATKNKINLVGFNSPPLGAFYLLE